mgnify:FL=1
MYSVTFFDWQVYVEGKFSTRQQNDKRVHVCMLYSLINMSDVYEELSMWYMYVHNYMCLFFSWSTGMN